MVWQYSLGYGRGKLFLPPSSHDFSSSSTVPGLNGAALSQNAAAAADFTATWEPGNVSEMIGTIRHTLFTLATVLLIKPQWVIF